MDTTTTKGGSLFLGGSEGMLPQKIKTKQNSK